MKNEIVENVLVTWTVRSMIQYVWHITQQPFHRSLDHLEGSAGQNGSSLPPKNTG